MEYLHIPSILRLSKWSGNREYGRWGGDFVNFFISKKAVAEKILKNIIVFAF